MQLGEQKATIATGCLTYLWCWEHRARIKPGLPDVCVMCREKQDLCACAAADCFPVAARMQLTML